MDLSKRDRKLIWHPFTQEKLADLPVVIVKGKGCYLYDEKNNKYLDLISSWWVNLHGHAQPQIARSIYNQCCNLEHVLFAGYTHEPAVVLCEKLNSILPDELCKFFFSDNGSTAVEVALKMCYQYWKNKGLNKPLFLAFEGGYHGDTFGCMSVGLASDFHNIFTDLCFEVKFVPFPNTWIDDEDVEEKEQNALEVLQKCINENLEKIAGLIVEPLVQCSAGMKMCRPNFIRSVVQLLKKHDILTIFDEVATGFGRTGTYFALLQTEVVPDFLCLSKGITGGFLPLSLTITTLKIYNSFLGDTIRQAFLHGHSYTANPLGCAAAIASYDLLTTPETVDAIKKINQTHIEQIKILMKNCENVTRGRVTGTISAFDVNENVDMQNLKQNCLQEGILIRPLNRTVYLLPPYCITIVELIKSYQILISKLNE
ncbi:hypothetical protein PGB90_005163 [Kerria lacca]